MVMQDQAFADKTNQAALFAAQGMGDTQLQAIPAGSTFTTGGGNTGIEYTWRKNPDGTVSYVSQKETPITTYTTALPYAQMPNPSKGKVYVRDTAEHAEQVARAYADAGNTGMQVIFVSPDGDPYKRRVYDIDSIIAGGPAYTGTQNVLASNIGQNTYNPYTGQGTYIPETGVPSTGQTAANQWQAATGISPADLIAQTEANNQAARTWNATGVGTPVPITETATGITNQGVPVIEPTIPSGPSTYDTMDTTPLNTINAQNITWRTLPPEIKTFPFWQAGASTSGATAGTTTPYTFQQPQYSSELFQPSAQLWNRYVPSEREAYQSAVQGTGAKWDDVWQGLQKKWGAMTPSSSQGRLNWTPAGYNR